MGASGADGLPNIYVDLHLDPEKQGDLRKSEQFGPISDGEVPLLLRGGQTRRDMAKVAGGGNHFAAAGRNHL